MVLCRLFGTLADRRSLSSSVVGEMGGATNVIKGLE